MPFGIQWINFYAQVHHEKKTKIKLNSKKVIDNADTCCSIHF